MRAWSRSTNRRGSRSAGSAPGRTRASTTRSRGSGRETFVVAHPPPNVTGALHTGHALQISVAGRARPLAPDARVRDGVPDRVTTTRGSRPRTRSRSTWPRRARRGRTSGARSSWSSCWDWLREYGGTIMHQFRRMGASMDYRRERFTMDDEYVRAVMRFFVHLHGQGLDLPGEPDHQLVPVPRDVALGPRARARGGRRRADVHPLSVRRRRDGGVTIATARPATILADVAVAVNPEDERWRDAIGREVLVPFVERAVPVIADERVDIEFGTGALKVTPAHDPLDFEIGRDHGLPEPSVIGPDGRMNEDSGRAGRPDAGGSRAAHPRLDQGARAAREARGLPPLGRALRAVRRRGSSR